LGSRLVAGEFYNTTPTIHVNNTYVGLNLRLNRNWGLEYRIEPYVDEDNQRVLNHVFGLKAQLSY
jgi:hypothetical protein